jgi:hypothetical protein
MSEQHHLSGSARGEPLETGRTGARVRIPLDSPPGPHWSNALASALVKGLVGHRAIGHLQLDHLVQGAEIVLDGVETCEAELLGPVLLDAVEAANRACAGDKEQPSTPNMDPAEADEVARIVESRARR